MSAEGFYRRPLPEPLIPFSSSEGRQIFREALEMEGMAGYFPLAEQFHTQAEPAFCGLGTYLIVIAVRVPIPSTENVVLGGLFTSTALTLVVLPALYAKFGKFLLAKANQLVRENGKVVQASFER